MIKISASILNVEQEGATKTFYNLETAKINCFHIDVMDGKFVKTSNLKNMKDYALTISHISNLGLDVHLMVKDVKKYVDEYINLSPEIITFHIEAIEDENEIFDIINIIKENGIKVGLAISPDTKLEKILKFLPYIHMVLVMTVVPGKGGQSLIPETLEKVSKLKSYLDENDIDIDIEVDGGINNITSKMAIEAGANILVVGSYLIKSENYSETVKELK